MMICSSLTNWIQSWLRDYDRLQSFTIILIYLQIGCALIGSVGALYTGVLLINLCIALFALVAIESSSQRLVRTYAVLLFCALLLDISWFILFSYDIWNLSSKDYGKLFIFSVRVAFIMQIVGFSVRLSSSFFWIQMYRLGVSYLDTSALRETDVDRHSFLNPTTHPVVRQTSDSDGVLGGCNYDPPSYSSLFEDSQESEFSDVDRISGIGNHRATSVTDASKQKLSIGRSFQAIDEEKAINKSQLSTSMK